MTPHSCSHNLIECEALRVTSTSNSYSEILNNCEPLGVIYISYLETKKYFKGY